MAEKKKEAQKRSRSSENNGASSSTSVYANSVVEAIMSDWRTAHRVLEESRMHDLILKAREIALAEPTLLSVKAPLNICGDLHGQIYNLVEIFESGGLPPKARYLFLGDYVDRGRHGTECMILLIALKVLYPEQIHILRGNHESDSVCRIYGFFDECKRRFSFKLYKVFTDLFNVLPIAAQIEERALCMHGGLSPELYSLAQIERIHRPLVVGDTGLVCDLLWADPEPGIVGWGYNERGVSNTFGADVVAKFCRRHDLDLIIRAHQVVDRGYSFFADRKLVTVFSASNYCGEFDNCGAMLMMNEELRCKFQIFHPENSAETKTTTLKKELD